MIREQYWKIPDVKITFREEKHEYFVEYDNISPEKLPSCTGITRIWAGKNKVQRLQSWGVSLAINHLRDQAEHKGLDSDLFSAESLKVARTVPEKELNRFGDIGTEVHRQIHAWCIENGQVEPENLGEGAFLLPRDREAVENAMRLFRLWILDKLNKGWTIEGCEVLLCRMGNYPYAGTADMVMRNPEDEKVIVDFKTREQIHKHEDALQLTGYIDADSYCTGEDAVGGLIVRLPRKKPTLPPEYFVTTESAPFHVFQALSMVYYWSQYHK